MNIHKNARLTLKGREILVRRSGYPSPPGRMGHVGRHYDL